MFSVLSSLRDKSNNIHNQKQLLEKISPNGPRPAYNLRHCKSVKALVKKVPAQTGFNCGKSYLTKISHAKQQQAKQTGELTEVVITAVKVPPCHINKILRR